MGGNQPVNDGDNFRSDKAKLAGNTVMYFQEL